eukprot:TRINITY_DN6906_c0_g1_i1.p1 TRINITY_DN6906_c0_g1~~TRINITY_DN6906_c0_g1_i1.p1  ORF type:complete len:115 (-),score=15.43 TRINITY_DN6906_c0_g1_i1:89-433(-)
MSGPASQKIPPLEPNTYIDMEVSLAAPGSPGTYAGSWMLCANNKGMPVMFGEPIWVIVTVENAPTIFFGEPTLISGQQIPFTPLTSSQPEPGFGGGGNPGDGQQNSQDGSSMDM